jgi:molybdopterin-guanine dinucleotide biosynthesis protein A
MRARPLLAVFVGGQSRRMGTPKGLLRAPDGGQPIVEALCRQGLDAGFALALVGDAAPYAGLAQDVPRLADDPADAGPIGGLHSALRFAEAHSHRVVVATACDMPRVSAAVLEELSTHPSHAEVLAARRHSDAPWEPMLARYDTARVLGALDAALAEGVRSFQRLFDRLEVEAWPLTPQIERALTDWDTPADVGA